MKSLKFFLLFAICFSFAFSAEARHEESSRSALNAALLEAMKDQKEVRKKSKKKSRASHHLIRKKTAKKEVVTIDPGTDFETLSKRKESSVLKWRDSRRKEIKDIPFFVSSEE